MRFNIELWWTGTICYTGKLIKTIFISKSIFHHNSNQSKHKQWHYFLGTSIILLASVCIHLNALRYSTVRYICYMPLFGRKLCRLSIWHVNMAYTHLPIHQKLMLFRFNDDIQIHFQLFEVVISVKNQRNNNTQVCLNVWNKCFYVGQINDWYYRNRF